MISANCIAWLANDTRCVKSGTERAVRSTQTALHQERAHDVPWITVLCVWIRGPGMIETEGMTTFVPDELDIEIAPSEREYIVGAGGMIMFAADKAAPDSTCASISESLALPTPLPLILAAEADLPHTDPVFSTGRMIVKAACNAGSDSTCARIGETLAFPAPSPSHLSVEGFIINRQSVGHAPVMVMYAARDARPRPPLGVCQSLTFFAPLPSVLLLL